MTDTRHNYQQFSVWENRKQSIETLVIAGWSQKLISILYDVSQGRICYVMKQLGIQSRDKSNFGIRNGRYITFGTDINGKCLYHNFLNSWFPQHIVERNRFVDIVIVINPPYSIKKKFYDMCMWHGLKFALLIPADYTQWVINAIQSNGCAKLTPTSRINFITPSGLDESNGHTARFHSLWLTRRLIRETEKFVTLTKEERKDI